MKSFFKALIGIELVFCSLVFADPYPPLYSNGAGTSIHFDPVSWPTEPADPKNCGATCGQWKPYTRFQNNMADPRTGDPSNGGTAPQGLANVSSSCTDKALPSIYYYLRQGATPVDDVLMFRWRVEQGAHNYATGPSPGNYGASSPWSSALWTVLFDVSGSGYRTLAAHLNGSTGAPATPVDLLVGIWGENSTQSLDYINDPSVHQIAHNPTAFVGPGNRILNFHGSLAPDENWPNGASETEWDYGTTRAKLVSQNSCTEYFIDYQIPIAMLDASGMGGPSISRDTPIAMVFCTANSLNNPFQKDCAINKGWVADAAKPAPFGDYLSFNQTTPYSQPIISAVSATAPTSCPGSYALQATVQDTLALQSGNVVTSVKNVDFYYWYDRDGDGSATTADTGSAWTKITPTSALKSGSLNTWLASWDATGLSKGKYLIGVQAVDDNTKIDDGMTASGVDNRTFSYLAGDTGNQIYLSGAWIGTQQSVFPTHSPSQAPSTAENWYGNPDVTGNQIAVIGTAINACGFAPTMSLAVSADNVVAGGSLNYTVSITNPSSNASSVTISSISDTLPAGFSFVASSSLGTGGFSSTDPDISGQSLTWTFGSPVSLAPGASATLRFTVTASSTSGVYNNSATAQSSFGTLSAGPVAVAVDAARISMTSTPDSYSVAADGSDQITFTLTYANDSTVAVTSGAISTTLPAGVTYVTCSGGTSCSNSSGVVTWAVGNIAGGASAAVSYTLTVPNTWSTSSLAVSATLAATAPDGSPTSTSASSTVAVTGVTVAGTPAFTLSKSASVARVAPGGSITYTLNYKNYGTASASSVVITDVLPAGLTYSSCTGSCSNSSGTVTWNIGTVAANASGSVTVTAAVSSATPFTFANPIENSASINWSGGSAIQATASVGVSGDYCSAVFYFRQGADNNIATVRPATEAIPAGSTDYVTTLSGISDNTFGTYLTETNQVVFEQSAGLGSALNISGQTLTISYYLSAAQGGGRAQVILRNDTTNTTIATSADQNIATGATSLYTFTAAVPASTTIGANDKLRWYFQFRASGGKDITFHYDSATFNSRSSFCSTTSPADLSVGVTVDTSSITAASTQLLTYTIKYANNGGTSATNTVLADTLPANFTNCQSSTNGSTWNSCSTAGGNSFSLGTIASGSSGTVYVRGNAPASSTAGSTLTNTAAISSDQTSSVSATAATSVTGAGGSGTASLVANFSADNTSIVPGDTVTYTVTVVNVGDASAANVAVSNALPVSTYYTYGSCSGGCVNNSNTLTWSVGALAAGASQSYTYTMTAGTTGLASGITVINDSAGATANGGLSATSNAVAVALSGNPQLAIANTATPDTGLRPGDTINYALTVTNNGSATASDVIVSNPIPAYTSYKGSITASAGSGSFDAIGNGVSFNVGNLAAGASATLSFAVTVSALDSGNTTITSAATASAANAAQQSAVETASASAAATLDITHSISGSAAYPSATLTAAASSTTLYVSRTDRLQIGQLISVNGTVAQIVSLSTNSIVVDTSITASGSTPVIGALTLNIAYQNTGDASASSTVLTDTIPAGLGYYASSSTPDTVPTSGSSGNVTWNIGTLAASTSGSRQIYVFPTGTTGTLTSTALIAASNAASDSANASIAIGGISVTKSTSTSTRSAGDVATYTITLTNSLASPVTNITATDTLASGFTYRTGSASVGGNAIEPTFAVSDTNFVQPAWSGLTVAANGTLVIVFDADIDADAGANNYQNEVAVDVPAGIGLLPFDALQTIAEDVSVLSANSGVLNGYVFERVAGTTNNYESGNDLPLASVRVEIYQAGADCSDPYSATCFVVYTDNNGYFEKTVAAQGWYVKVISGTGELGSLWTQTIGNNDTLVTVPDQGSVTDHNGFIQTQSFTVTATAGSGGSASPASQSVLSGNTASVTVTSDSGYSVDTVTGCGGSLSGSVYTTAAIAADCTVSASFNPNYTVTFDLNGGTRTGGGALTQTVVSGGAATAPTLTPPSGFTFSSWDMAFNNVTGDLTVTAQYTTNSYTVTPSAGSGGSISPGIAQTVAYGNTTSLSVTADSGYAIASVSGCGGSLSGTTYTTGTITGNCTVAATFSVADHTVTPSAGSGGTISPSTPQPVADGNTTSFTVTPATGYSISSVSGCGGSLSGNTYTTGTITADCSVSAAFTQNSYTVTFDLDGGTRTGGGALSQSVSHGGAATAPTLTPPAGHTFSSWDVTFSSITSNLAVTAQYTIDNFTVTPSAGSGGSISPGVAQTVAYGNTRSFTVTASGGYAIASVSGCGGSLSGNTYTTGVITGNCTVTATFSVGDHTVTPSAGSGGSMSPSTPQAVADGNTTSFTVTPDTGYGIDTVSGCGGSLTGSTYTTAAITADCSVSAAFTLNSYTVTFDLDGGTRTGGGALSQSVSYGGAATAPTLTPPAGRSFSSWNVPFNNITGNLAVTAQYTPDNYTVMPSAGTGGSISPAVAQTVAYGNTTSFTVTADSGYAIASVSGCGGSLVGTTYTTGVITGNCSVTATFGAGGHTVTPTAGSGGSISPATPQTVADGGTTSFVITPDTGYSIGTVSGCAGTLAASTFTTAAVTADCSVSAAFTLNSYTVTFDLDGGTRTGGGALSQSISYGGAAMAPTLTPPAGRTFSNWDIAFNNITGNLTVTAQYSANNYTVTPSAGSGGSINPGTAQTVAYGNTASFSVTADSGYAIASVSGCGGSLIGTTYTTSAVAGDCTVMATFSAGGHTVTPSAGSGGALSPSTPQTVANANTTSFSVTPDTGYSISSVSGCGGSLSGNVFTTAAITSNCSVSAAFVLNSYTVTFDLNGGTRTGGGLLSQTVNHGSAATAPTLTPPAGHVFSSWNVAFSNITGNLTITAQYTANNYTVTPSAGSGGSINPGAGQSVAYGNTTSFAISPDTGHAISSVSGCGGSLIGTTYTTGAITSNCTVSATFVFGGHTVTPSAGTGGSITPSTPQTIANGNTASFVVTPDNGYSIDTVTGCGGSLSGSVYSTATITADCSLNASFTLNSYTVTFNLAGGIRTGGGTLSQSVAYGGAAIAPTLTPPAGKVFSSWSTSFNSVTGNLSVNAQYNDADHAVSISVGAGGSATPSTTQTVANGNTASFTVTPDAGYAATASGCGGSLSNNVYTTGAIAADCTVAITFSQNTYTVTPTAGAGGSINPAIPQSVAHGTTRVFTVTPNSGYSVSGVNGCLGSLSGNTFTTGAITADCSVSASFTQTTYAVTPVAGAGGSITPSAVQMVAFGGSSSFTIAADTGYSIQSVTGCGGTRSDNTYNTGAITADCSVSVSFTALPDDDFDGILDAVETTMDSDGDGLPNYLDRDSDNDGIPDAIESGQNGDSSKTPVDTDRDGVPDYLDLDSDNDGIGDRAEGGGIGVDIDGDNLDDHFDVDSTGGTDGNGNGVDDAIRATDTDLDGVPDYHDLDTDNDSIMDVDEAGRADANRDGMVDDGSRTDTPRDSDGDSIADFRDIDSDNDGVKDIVENGSGILDRNNDGRIDAVNDGDGDGIPDIFDALPLIRGTSTIDTDDDDNIPAVIDKDDDGDGIPDVIDGNRDSDGDGVPDSRDRDSDNDGIPDILEIGWPQPSGFDSDQDGIDDVYDVDSTGGIDATGDGIDDKFIITDADGDGLPNYLDDDSDNDGLPDVYEQLKVVLSSIDSDGDGIDDAIDVDSTGGVDANGDGIDDDLIRAEDMDGDGKPDYLDTNSDGDNFDDNIEDGDFNQDGINDRLQRDPGLRAALRGNGGGGGALGMTFIATLGLMACRRRAWLLVALAATNAAAADHPNNCQPDKKLDVSNDGCWYVGVGYGESRLKPDDSDSGWKIHDNTDNAWQVSVGYQLYRHWFVEARWADLGKVTLKNRNPLITGSASVDYSAPSLWGGYWLREPDAQWNLFAKIGYAKLSTDGNDIDVDHMEGAQLSFGVGAQWRFDERWFSQIEYVGYDKDAHYAGVSLNRYLGQAKGKQGSAATQ